MINMNQPNNSSSRLHNQNPGIERPALQQLQQQHIHNYHPRSNRNNFLRRFLGMRIPYQNLRFIQQKRILFLSAKSQVVDPASEGYWTMLKDNFFPHLQCLSVTLLVIIVCIAYFTVAVSLDLLRNSLLEVEPSTLTDLGMNSAKLVYRGEVWRLVTSLFLHVNLIHLVANLFLVIIFMSSLEHSFGSLRMTVVFLGSGIAGSIFSNLTQPDPDNIMLKAGISTPLYGLVGASLGYMFINWPSLSLVGHLYKLQMFIFIFYALLFLIIFGDQASNVDYLAHFGGLFSGVFLSFILETIDTGTRQTVSRIVLAVLYAIMVFACFIIFYVFPRDTYSN